MNLYHIQDSDRPMWVIAHNWSEALNRWKTLIAEENSESVSDVLEPNGISLICNSEDLILPDEAQHK